MTSRIDLSISGRTPAAVQSLRQVLQRYEESHNCIVQLSVLGWDTIWKDMVNIGIYKRGADLSEIGTTWIGSFVSMNALRSYTPAEIEHIGGEKAFLPNAWQTTSLVGDERRAIPFLSDVRALYWRDMLKRPMWMRRRPVSFRGWKRRSAS
jgi:multiple sugar transport system substrate-binding protein/arabinogalactan oligomer/maltooligosaccharide transport system substrate-binding protein